METAIPENGVRICYTGTDVKGHNHQTGLPSGGYRFTAKNQRLTQAGTNLMTIFPENLSTEMRSGGDGESTIVPHDFQDKE